MTTTRILDRLSNFVYSLGFTLFIATLIRFTYPSHEHLLDGCVTILVLLTGSLMLKLNRLEAKIDRCTKAAELANAPRYEATVEGF